MFAQWEVPFPWTGRAQTADLVKPDGFFLSNMFPLAIGSAAGGDLKATAAVEACERWLWRQATLFTWQPLRRAQPGIERSALPARI